MKSGINKYDQINKKNGIAIGLQISKAFDQLANELSIAIPKHGIYNQRFKIISKEQKERLYKQLEPLFKKNHKQLERILETGLEKNWQLAQNKNDAEIFGRIKDHIGDDVLIGAAVFSLFNIKPDYKQPIFKGGKKITWSSFKKGLSNKTFEKDLSVYREFIGSKVDGLSLSDRVWNLQEGNRQLIKHYLEAGFHEGKSANELARELKIFLKEPDRLYRRVRNDKGELITSRPASEYHPGQGVYKSSFKNAKRLAQSEIKRMYETANHHRRLQDPAVVGVEVILSAAHPKEDICDDLEGKYPKGFLFTLWHPNCWCVSVNILVSKDNFSHYIDNILNDGGFDPTKDKNYVKNVPPNFTKHILHNRDKISKYKSAPYYIKDNFKGGDIKKGLIINS